MTVKMIDFQHASAPSSFAESLITTGFAIITNHPIDQNLIFNTYDDWKAFFASDDKHRYLFKEEEQTGYFPIHISETAKGYDQKDIKEFYSYYDWAPCPQRVSANTQRLYGEMLTLGKTLLGWIEGETPARIKAALSVPLSAMLDRSNKNLLRIIHYPPLSGDEAQGAVRAAPHEDINLITLLPAATAPGLEVKDVNGNWHALTCNPGAIIVNTGDMLDLATEGFYKATTHQVVNPQGEAAKEPRYSMPFFLHPRDDIKLSSTLTANEFLEQRLRELGLKS